MSVINSPLERELLETDAGQAVYDALVQANIDLRTVSAELVKDMIAAEIRHRRQLGLDRSYSYSAATSDASTLRVPWKVRRPCMAT
ncbi:MAG: hypothetical protein KDA85_08495 [Planctomycetaceae bacterium]|nr:hypothetical protein [Planctomycetaceae bacterium]